MWSSLIPLSNSPCYDRYLWIVAELQLVETGWLANSISWICGFPLSLLSKFHDAYTDAHAPQEVVDLCVGAFSRFSVAGVECF